ncbi:MAG: hypothetical protein VB934_15380 [Polyangiaceae bacterium]
MSEELNDIITYTLEQYGGDHDGNPGNLASRVFRDILAEKLQERISERFHVLRMGTANAS